MKPTKKTKKKPEISFAQNKKRNHKLFSPVAFFFCVISGSRKNDGRKKKRCCLLVEVSFLVKQLFDKKTQVQFCFEDNIFLISFSVTNITKKNKKFTIIESFYVILNSGM